MSHEARIGNYSGTMVASGLGWSVRIELQADTLEARERAIRFIRSVYAPVPNRGSMQIRRAADA